MSSTDAPVPVAIEREGDVGILIRWADGGESRWTATALRDACPCATCREKRRRQGGSKSGTNVAAGIECSRGAAATHRRDATGGQLRIQRCV